MLRTLWLWKIGHCLTEFQGQRSSKQPNFDRAFCFITFPHKHRFPSRLPPSQHHSVDTQERRRRRRRNGGFPFCWWIAGISAITMFVWKRRLPFAPARSRAWKHQCHTRCFPIKTPWCNVRDGPRCSCNFKAAPLTSLDTLQGARLYWQLQRICDGFLFLERTDKGFHSLSGKFFSVAWKKKMTKPLPLTSF